MVLKRHATKYPGVFYREVARVGAAGTERMYYVRYKRNGVMVETKIGGQYRDDMTPARVNQARSELIEGKRLSQKEKRRKQQEKALAQISRPTMTRLWEAFKEQKSGKASFKDDKSRWGKHLEPVFGNKTPAEILTLDVDRMRIRLLKGKAPATVKQVLVLLRRMINFGVQRGLCPAPDLGRLHIELPKVNNIVTEDLSPEQLKKLMEAIEKAADWRAAGVLRMALYTGMRRGELLALRWQDIDLKRGFINILDPKGGQDQVIPLNDCARETLESLPRGKSAYLFPGRKGQKATDLKKPILAIKKAAGLPTAFRPCHGLRHVYASALASSGKVDLHTLQRLLTHKSPQMTHRYAHLRDETLRRAAGVASDIFRKAEGE